jgi:hypothetical protein
MSGTFLPDRSQIFYNTVLNGHGLFRVELPGHLLFLTNGAVRICHWVIRGQCWDLGDFIGHVQEHYPQQIRVGIAPDAPANPCPFYVA